MNIAFVSFQFSDTSYDESNTLGKDASNGGKELKMKQYYILFNPLAGNGEQTKLMIDVLQLTLGEESIESVIDMTHIHSYERFFSGLPEEDEIILCGGDGTLNHFINETAGIAYKNPILYCATGTGNDFVKDIRGTSWDDPIPIGQYLKGLPTVTVNGKSYRFLNGVGYGIDGYCCEVGDRLKATTDKPVNYTSIAAKGLLFHYKPTAATVTVDGTVHRYQKVWIAPTMHGRFYGGGMMPTPEQSRTAEPRQLSVMVLHDSGKLKTLMMFPTIFKGEHIKYKKYIDVFSGKRITVEFDRPTALQIDGETILDVTSYSAEAFVREEVCL